MTSLQGGLSGGRGDWNLVKDVVGALHAAVVFVIVQGAVVVLVIMDYCTMVVLRCVASDGRVRCRITMVVVGVRRWGEFGMSSSLLGR